MQPSNVVKGPAYVIDHETVAGEDYLLVVSDYRARLSDLLEAQREQGDPPVDVESLTPTGLRDGLVALQRDILHVASGERCRIPGYVYTYLYERDDPDSTVVDEWRVAFRRYDGEHYYLEFMDERCEMSGPSLRTWTSPSVFSDPGSRGNLALVRDQSDRLWLIDPWKGKKKRVASDVLAWDYVAAWPDNSLDDEETGVITLEGERAEAGPDGEAPVPLGELVLRRLTGEEVTRFGQGVPPGFAQTNFGGLRVAWASDGVLYEAVAPDLRPVRLTPLDEQACDPQYVSGQLEFLYPCDEARLNRLDLRSGELERLEPGIANEWMDRGWSFERRYTGDPDPETGLRPSATWTKAPGADQFKRIEPPMRSVRAIDAERLLGISEVESGYGDLGTWDFDGTFEPILQRVSFYYTFEDTRYTADREEPIFLWVVHHGIRRGVGEISLLSSRDLSIESIAEGVPEGGFRQYSFAAVRNPALVVLRDLTPGGGVLEARMIPDLLGTRVDEGVIGFTSRSSYQEPGLYYSVGPGEREGIWFAPL